MNAWILALIYTPVKYYDEWFRVIHWKNKWINEWGE